VRIRVDGSLETGDIRFGERGRFVRGGGVGFTARGIFGYLDEGFAHSCTACNSCAIYRRDFV
jgi:hypothetical protein